MKAGAMKYKLQIFKPETTTNHYGEKELSFSSEPTATVWAEQVKQTGHRSEEVGEHFPDYNAEFNIRDAHEIKENWRVQQLGGYLYNVVAIIPNIDRGMNTLVCERVNE